MADALLNVSAVRPRTATNGPGWRAAVWVQGCSLGCPGCFNPSTHAHEARRFWVPEQLAERMMDRDVEGISILGGEPFEQAAACARLARRARELGGSVVTYSGYTHGYLAGSDLPEVRALLAETDMLVAGPYVESLRTDGRAWHGSSNQELVFLTDRYDERALVEAQALPVVEGWSDGRVVDWSGIPALTGEAAPVLKVPWDG